MKALKIALTSLVLVLSLALMVPLSRGYLSVNVSADPETILPSEKVTITSSAEMDGKGIIYVIQPVSVSSRAQSESEDVQNGLNEISNDPDYSLWKIISYAWVDAIIDPEGGQQNFTFPDDFTGLNGEPSTSVLGKYYVFFVFWHGSKCFSVKTRFDCSMFWVVPEYPIGTIMGVLIPFLALFSGRWIKSRKQIK